MIGQESRMINHGRLIASTWLLSGTTIPSHTLISVDSIPSRTLIFVVDSILMVSSKSQNRERIEMKDGKQEENSNHSGRRVRIRNIKKSKGQIFKRKMVDSQVDSISLCEYMSILQCKYNLRSQVRTLSLRKSKVKLASRTWL